MTLLTVSRPSVNQEGTLSNGSGSNGTHAGSAQSGRRHSNHCSILVPFPLDICDRQLLMPKTLKGET